MRREGDEKKGEQTEGKGKEGKMGNQTDMKGKGWGGMGPNHRPKDRLINVIHTNCNTFEYQTHAHPYRSPTLPLPLTVPYKYSEPFRAFFWGGVAGSSDGSIV